MAITAPSSVTATIGPPLAANTLSLTWTAGTSTFSGLVYDVQRQVDSGSYLTVVTGTTTRTQSFNTSPGTRYSFRVRSRSSLETSGYTTSNTVFTPSSAPSTVSLGRVDGDLAAIRVSWTEMKGATGYDVDRREGGGSWVRVSTGTTATIRTYTGLNRGSTYTFRVRTNSTGGTSSFKESFNNLTLFPFAPSSVTATKASNNSIKVTWPASNGATSYDVDRRQDGGSYSRVTSGTTSRDITYTLTQGPTYQFRVFSRNSAGQSPTARESDSVFLPPPPPRPSSATATKTKRDVRITFPASTPPPGTTIIEYQIEIKENNGSFGNRRIDNGGGETYTNLNPGSTYQGRVRAIGEGGASDWRESNTVTISSPPTQPSFIIIERPIPTKNVNVFLGASSAASDVTISAYEIQRRESLNGGSTWGDWGETRTTNTTDRTTVYTNLNSYSTYQFRGRALSDFNPSAYRTSETILIPGIPDAPSQVLAILFGTEILLAISNPIFDGGAPILSYTVERRESLDRGVSWSPWEIFQVLEPPVQSYLDSTVLLQKTYQYRVFSTNEQGDSATITGSNSVYVPRILQVYDSGPRTFRNPLLYKRYDATVGIWFGLNISKKYIDGQWVDLD
jgi:hypothetical protein